MAATLREIEKSLDEHHEILFGNGRPGLKERMQDAERDIEEHQKFIDGVKADFNKLFIGTIGALIVMAVGAIGTVAFTSWQKPTIDPKAFAQEIVRAMKAPDQP